MDALVETLFWKAQSTNIEAMLADGINYYKLLQAFFLPRKDFKNGIKIVLIVLTQSPNSPYLLNILCFSYSG